MTLYKLGKEIRKLRKQRKITQASLCTIAGISRPTLSKIEQGQFANVSVRALDRILTALGYELSLQAINIAGLPPLRDE